MKRIVNSLFGLALFAVPFVASAHAQTASTVYAESFRKGATHITEDSFEARLNPQTQLTVSALKTHAATIATN